MIKIFMGLAIFLAMSGVALATDGDSGAMGSVLNLIAIALSSAVTIIVPFILKLILGKLKIQKGEAQNKTLEMVKTAAAIGVRYASQTLNGGNRGAEKKEYVKKFVKEFISNNAGIKINDSIETLIDTTIECVVNELTDSRKINEYLGNVEKPIIDASVTV